jgi:hypothetical protein
MICHPIPVSLIMQTRLARACACMHKSAGINKLHQLDTYSQFGPDISALFHLQSNFRNWALLCISMPTFPKTGSRDSAVRIATGYGLVGTKFFSSSRRPDRFWGPSSLLSNGYRRFFPECKAAGA